MGEKDMRTDSRMLRLSRETVRDLNASTLAGVAGAALSPPTFCNCTGTETVTLICCLTRGCFDTIPATQCACTGTETANTYCVC
jgi:hypothetical protein